MSKKKWPVLSSAASKRLFEKMRIFLGISLLATFCSIPTFLLLFMDPWSVFYTGHGNALLAILLVPWLITFFAILWHYRKVRIKNLVDFERSKRLETVLRKISETDVYPIAESDSLVGTGQPFRVEREISHATRGELAGSMSLTGFGGAYFAMAFSARGTFKGTEKGYSIPDLLDASTMILLQRPDGSTLRVLIPSPRTTKEMLVRAVERMADYCGKGTYSAEVLSRFALSEKGFELPLSHPATIDAIDAACATKSIEERPSVAVFGNEIMSGVVFASALGVGGNRETYFPTGFIAQFSQHFNEALGAKLASPALEPAVKV